MLQFFTFPAIRMRGRTEGLHSNDGSLPPCLKLGTGAVVMGISGTSQQLNWLCQLLSITDEHMRSFIKPLIFQWIDWDCGQELPQVQPLALPYMVLAGVLNGFPLVILFMCMPTTSHGRTEYRQNNTCIKFKRFKRFRCLSISLPMTANCTEPRFAAEEGNFK